MSDEEQQPEDHLKLLFEYREKLLEETRQIVNEDSTAWQGVIETARELEQLSSNYASLPIHFAENEVKPEVIEIAQVQGERVRAPAAATEAKKPAKKKQNHAALEEKKTSDDKMVAGAPESDAGPPEPLKAEETPQKAEELAETLHSRPEDAKSQIKEAKTAKSQRSSGTTEKALNSDGALEAVEVKNPLVLSQQENEILEDPQRIEQINQLLQSVGVRIIKYIDGAEEWLGIKKTDVGLERSADAIEEAGRPRTPDNYIQTQILSRSTHKRPDERVSE